MGDRLEQAGASRYRGIDFTVSGQVVPRVTLIAAADLIDAKILRADDPAIVGKVPTNVPRFSCSLFAEYQPLDGLFVSTGVFHVSRKPGDDANALFYVRATRRSTWARATRRGSPDTKRRSASRRPT